MVRFVVGYESMKHLGIAIGLFVALDLAAFSIGFTISREVGESAVAINLAGRQRMLSQRITKAALLATNTSVGKETRESARQEVDEAYALFQATLRAFAEGGAPWVVRERPCISSRFPELQLALLRPYASPSSLGLLRHPWGRR